MSDAAIFDYIDVLAADGSVLEGVFLPGRYDLWSPDRRRLTLLFDPGRVKTQLTAHEALGRALEAGQTYRLRIRGDALDAAGDPLGKDFVHVFSVGQPDLIPPNPTEWTINAPRLGTLDALVVELGSPHDHLSMAFRIRVRDAVGKVVPGRIDLGYDEASWIFRPTTEWQSQVYDLSIDERLEDLAGNRPAGLFDRPASVPDLSWQTTIALRFQAPG